MSTPPDFGKMPEDELVPPPYELGPSPVPPTRSPVLRRSNTDKVVAGVAGGLGRYLGIDPIILRIAFVVLTLAGLAGILVYIIGWIAIPEEKPGEQVGSAQHSSGNTARMIIGGLLILVGGAALFDNLIPNLSKYFWPAAIILLGAGVLFGGMGRRS
jgi:phage shock protein C